MTTTSWISHTFRLRCTLSLLLLCLAVKPALAHEHDDDVSEDDLNAPVDAILWIHMFLQAAVWGFVFPVGMVLGLSRSKWHVPLQSTGIVLTIGGYILGHMHGGRKFLESAHGTFANVVMIFVAAQLGLGIYLKLHIHERSIRPYVVILHGVIGKTYPIIGWTQMLFGAIAYMGYCRGGHLGQCLAHYIMGSGFIAYAVLMSILLLVGEGWVRRNGKSPEFYDSLVIMLWGIVNTFTEHRGNTWSVKDMQHTVLGVLWWTGGMLGLFLSRNGQRNVVPAIIIVITGWAFGGHAQALMFSTMIHTVFGYTLAVAGIARIIEVCFIAHKDTTPSLWGGDPDGAAPRGTSASGGISPLRAFRYIPPFFLVAGGLMFMSATDEETRFVNGTGMDHVTYILIVFSIAFFLYTLVLCLIHLYPNSGRNAADRSTSINGDVIEMHPAADGRPKWYAPIPTSSGEPEETRHIIGDEDD